MFSSSEAWAGVEINNIAYKAIKTRDAKRSRVFVYNLLNMRKLIFVLLVFLGAAFVFLSFGELESILETLQHGNVWLILLAVLIQLSWFLMMGLTYQSLYHVLGMEESVYRLSLLSASATFVNIVAPTIGMSGMAFFISHAARNGRPVGKVTIVTMLGLFLDYIAFLFVLALGLIVLFRRNDLGPTEIAASTVMFSIAAGFGFLLYLGSRSAEALGNTLAKMARVVNRILDPLIHRPYLSEARAHEFAHEMADDLKSLPGRLHNLALPLLYSVAGKALLICVLLTVFIAFEVPVTAGTIIGGFAISYLFIIITPTPAGVGIVEGVMPLALASLRVPWSEAVIVTLAYRGMTFWLPLALGAVAFRMLQRER
jgi:uncharacterized protein (TIRG00374 family)